MNWRINHPQFVLHQEVEYDDFRLDWKTIGYCWIPRRIQNNRALREAYILRYCEEDDFYVSKTGAPLARPAV